MIELYIAQLYAEFMFFFFFNIILYIWFLSLLFDFLSLGFSEQPVKLILLIKYFIIIKQESHNFIDLMYNNNQHFTHQF